MFNGSRFQRFSEDLDESVFALGGTLGQGYQRYRSRFAAKVRVDKWCQKTGCFRTMGRPRAPCNPPGYFLKKHSRLPPVFFDPEVLKSEIPKFKEKEIPQQNRRDRSRSNAQTTPNINKKQYKSVIKHNWPCKYPPPPYDMGLFRPNNEPSYEIRYRKRDIEKCCNNRHPDHFCCLPPNDNWDNNEIEPNENNPRPGRVGYNGPVEKIERGQRDFLKENALKVLRMPAKRPVRCYMDKSGRHRVDLSDGPFVLRPGFGQVPKYIQQRKWELYCQDLAFKREMEKGQCECPCRVLDPLERELILKGLVEHWNELNLCYLRLPTYQSDTIDRQKEQLEEKLVEVEKDLRLFQSSENIIVSDLANQEAEEDLGALSSHHSSPSNQSPPLNTSSNSQHSPPSHHSLPS